MQRVLLLTLCIISVLSYASCEYCHGKPSPSAQPNMQAVTQPKPQFVKSVANGAMYEILVDDQYIPIVHLWGTPYQKGLAHGQLTQDRMGNFVGELFSYLINQAAVPLNNSGMPMPQAKALAEEVINAGLDLTSLQTAPFTGAYYGEELQGMADGSGVSVDSLRRLQMLGELTKGSCSMFGLWDSALASGEGLLTMRALDWITDGPFQNYHQLTVYHADPNANVTENSFINMGWTAWIGSITGVNDKQMSIHEIGVSFPDKALFGNESTDGVPFNYVLRDILQFDSHRMDGVSRLASAHRTCDLILGVGDGKDRRMNSVAYSADVCLIMDDTNLQPVADWHPRLNSTVYHAMDWLCPGFNTVMHAQLSNNWGNLSVEYAIQEVLPIVQTGNLHVYIADLVNEQWFVSFAANDNSTSPHRNAFDRQWAQLDLQSIFQVQPTVVTADAQASISEQ